MKGWVLKIAHISCKKACWMEGWVGGWVEGRKEGWESRVKDCLQQSKTHFLLILMFGWEKNLDVIFQLVLLLLARPV